MNYKIQDIAFDKKWYEAIIFTKLDDVNKFLENNDNYGLLFEKISPNNIHYFAVADKLDTGKEKLDLFLESEDTGFCHKYYKSKNGRLYVLTAEGLYTCADDDYREPEAPVDASYFNIINPPKNNQVHDLSIKHLDIMQEACAWIEKNGLKDIKHPKYNRGDLIEFWSGANNDIRYRSKILGFDNEGKIYILWDCYWSPIKDDKTTQIKAA